MNKPILSAIAAMANNRVIGKDNQLPWHLPADLKHFKAITTGHPILMGRKTHESIGRPLPNRTNIILTRDPSYVAPGCMTATSIEAALQAAGTSSELFIIGGAEIYQQLMPQTQRLYLTLIHHAFDGDAYFPEWDDRQWQEISREDHVADADNTYAYSFLVLQRRQDLS